MRDYLNAAEKQHTVIIGALVGSIDLILEKWTGLDKEARKNIKTALTYSKKGLTNIFQNVNSSEQEKLQRLIRDLDVTMVTKSKKIFAVIDEEDALNIAEVINEKYCKECKGDVKKCKYRGILSNWGIDCFKTNEDYCEYSYK